MAEQNEGTDTEEVVQRAHLLYLRGERVAARQLLEELLARDPRQQEAHCLLEEITEKPVQSAIAAPDTASWQDDWADLLQGLLGWGLRIAAALCVLLAFGCILVHGQFD